MKRIFIVALAVVGVATVALADRSDVVVSSSADWRSLTVLKAPIADGGTDITAIVCGTAFFPDGGQSSADTICTDVDMSAAQTNAITTFMNNALARWKVRRGL